MPQRIFNTLSGKKEEFIQSEDGKVKIYVCGVTVYDHCHIGHARNAIIFDTIYRFFLSKNLNVLFVKNFTDIDDKIIKRAKEERIPWHEIAEKYIGSYYEDMKMLNILKPTYEPRATEHIEDMINLVEILVKKKNAYIVNGDVYFSVESFPKYGELSKRNLSEMLHGARVEIDEKKRNPLDFALWKASKEGEPFWDSPFGKGRPGWHIECSAMSVKYLGIPIDIHGGGQDLIFPHHENEKAQSEAAFGKDFVKYWVHHGFVNMGKEKMSKSLGNILLIKEFLKEYEPEALRIFFLSTHYKSPIEYTEKAIEDAYQALRRLYYTLMRAKELDADKITYEKPHDEVLLKERRFYEAMEDDFNTPYALSQLFELSRLLNRLIDEKDESAYPYILNARETLIRLSSIMGLLAKDPYTFEFDEKKRHLERIGLELEYVEKKIKERAEARTMRDYEKADRIRKELLEKGIVLQDTKEGTIWRIR
ncbi:MAG: cysteine--tRNA ligase [Desulfobacterota bacterium]|nr:cysteine--tRNA ligase [Thermodesulfobacteriota bacterium]MDW8001752.1 cysteine--tRNA ligase [Deltaproteobacteria bacterium]